MFVGPRYRSGLDRIEVLVIEDRLDSRLGDYYVDRVRLHMDDHYAGIQMLKFPEDLRTLEHILWDCAIDVVLEIGLGRGGSALWFRDRLRTLAQYGRNMRPTVVAVDIDTTQAREHLERVDPDYAATIKLVESDIRDPDVVARVDEHLWTGARILVVDDCAHRYDTTLATLRHFSHLVPISSYLVIEDGHRDIPGMLPADAPGKAHGVVDAINDWLRSEAAGRFVQRRDLERYIVTSNPGGWLQRIG